MTFHPLIDADKRVITKRNSGWEEGFESAEIKYSMMTSSAALTYRWSESISVPILTRRGRSKFLCRWIGGVSIASNTMSIAVVFLLVVCRREMEWKDGRSSTNGVVVCPYRVAIRSLMPWRRILGIQYTALVVRVMYSEGCEWGIVCDLNLLIFQQENVQHCVRAEAVQNKRGNWEFRKWVYYSLVSHQVDTALSYIPKDLAE